MRIEVQVRVWEEDFPGKDDKIILGYNKIIPREEIISFRGNPEFLFKSTMQNITDLIISSEIIKNSKLGGKSNG